MNFTPKFTITNRITADFSLIEQSGGFIEVMMLMEATFQLAEHLACEWTQ